MNLKQVKIDGFRNFKELIVNLKVKSLIIGPNEVGKTNFISALRFLLDRSYSEIDLEPKDSDFFVHGDINKIAITLIFENAIEDCIRSKFRENINTDGTLIIQYIANRQPKTTQKAYNIFVGPNFDNLKEYESRFYLKVLNLNYLDSNRDLHNFIRKEKRNLLERARDKRSPTEITQDDNALKAISDLMGIANKSVSELSFISKATASLNNELSSLSISSDDSEVGFDTGASDIKNYVDNLKLTSKYKGKTVSIGGDGRNNQVYLALWSAQRREVSKDPTEISINCIEEPEAHLHPHQQRKLSHYLISELSGQVLLTTHSPQIACEFQKDSIVSLNRTNQGSKAANDGCSNSIKSSLIDFGHRLNLIPAEGFFSDIVFLVEGVSEVLFYKALAKKCEIDLDKFNISIVPVDGIGFESFLDVYVNLGINFIIRTDLDIVKIPKKSIYRVAGLNRLIKIYKKFLPPNDRIDKLISSLGDTHEKLDYKSIPSNLNQNISELRNSFNEIGLYLANEDLENDLANSNIFTELSSFYDETDKTNLIEKMKEKKGTNMFRFLQTNFDSLLKLKDTSINLPLLKCIHLSMKRYE